MEIGAAVGPDLGDLDRLTDDGSQRAIGRETHFGLEVDAVARAGEDVRFGIMAGIVGNDLRAVDAAGLLGRCGRAEEQTRTKQQGVFHGVSM